MRFFRRRLLCLLTVCALVSSSVWPGVPDAWARRSETKKKEKDPFAAATGGIVLYSTKQEIELGKQVRQEVEKQYKLYDNKELLEYVRKIGAKVASYADRQNVTYEFFVLDDPLVNAFALPGGTIYVTRGILTIFENEAQLAAILGHEITHVVERHSMKHATGAAAVDILWKVYAASKGQSAEMPLWSQLAVDILGFKPFGRADEMKSDAVGMKYAYQAGYRADQAVKVFEEFKRRGGKHLPAFLLTHPVDDKRIAQINELWALIQTRGDIRPGASPLITGEDEYAKAVHPHTYRAAFPEVKESFDQMMAAVSRKDVGGVMKVIDKEFKSKMLSANREGMGSIYTTKFASVDRVTDTAQYLEFRFLGKDSISTLCRVTEVRVYADGRTETDATVQTLTFVKRAAGDGPAWKLKSIEAESAWAKQDE